MADRTKYTVQIERSRYGSADPSHLRASHHVHYPGTPVVSRATEHGTLIFTTPHWAGTVRESNDGTITAFLPVRGAWPNKSLGTFRTIQEAIETVIDFSRAYHEVGIELW